MDIDTIIKRIRKTIKQRVERVEDIQSKLDFFYTNGKLDPTTENLKLQRKVSEKKIVQEMHDQIKKLNRKISCAKKIEDSELKPRVESFKESTFQKELNLLFEFKVQKGYIHEKDLLYIGRNAHGNDRVHQKTNTRDYAHFHASVRGGSLVAINKKVEDKTLLYPWVLVYSKYYKSLGVTAGLLTQTTKAQSTGHPGSFIFTDPRMLKSEITDSKLYLTLYDNQNGRMSFFNTNEENKVGLVKYVLNFKVTDSLKDRWSPLELLLKKKGIFLSKKTMHDLNNFLPSYICLDSVISLT